MLGETVKEFSGFSGLNPNIAKCEIANLGPLKGVLEAVCGLKTADLTNDSITILRIHFSYQNETKTEWYFLRTVKKIQNTLNIWNTRIITLEGRILIFKTLGTSKIVYLSLIATVPNSTLNEIKKFRKPFYGTLQNLKLTTRHSAIRWKETV